MRGCGGCSLRACLFEGNMGQSIAWQGLLGIGACLLGSTVGQRLQAAACGCGMCAARLAEYGFVEPWVKPDCLNLPTRLDLPAWLDLSTSLNLSTWLHPATLSDLPDWLTWWPSFLTRLDLSV